MEDTLVALTLMISEPTHEQEQSQTCLNHVRRRKTKSKQDRGKGCHGKGGGELDQSKELLDNAYLEKVYFLYLKENGGMKFHK